MERRDDYVIVRRFLVAGEGWRTEKVAACDVTLAWAWRRASEHAHALDREYGDEHFWTVDLTAPDGGSFVQLFHGRLS
jgi:hypothetical protein